MLSTLHTIDATETVNRIIDFFPPHQQQQVRADARRDAARASSPSASCRAADGDGRVPAVEVMVIDRPRPRPDPRPARDGRLIEAIIAEGEYYGMQTFDQALYRAVTDGKVTMRDALRIASRPHDLELLIGTGGHTSTNIDDLDRYSPAEQPG